MVHVGIIGIGFMGMTHYRALAQVRGARVSAVATRNERRLAGDWRGIQGNFGDPGTKIDLGPIGRYADWRDMLRDPRIDLVDICLPPSLHAAAAIAAVEAGKHVLVEKPIALTTADAEKMVRAACKADRLLMVAQVLPYFPEYDFARRAIESGKYGRLLGGHFKRIIADPLWSPDFHDPQGSGGPVVDLHIHDAHFVRLVCGMPRGVFSSGRVRDGGVRFVNTQFLFDDAELSVTASSGVVDQQGRSFTHGFEIYLQRATLTYDFAVYRGEPTTATPLTVLTADGRVERPKLKPVDGFVAELTAATRAVRTGRASPWLAGEPACDALRLCHKQIESLRAGRIVRV